jgi:hypothetical protein
LGQDDVERRRPPFVVSVSGRNDRRTRRAWMRYLLLIHADEQAWEAASPEGREAMYAEYGKLMGEMEERGHLVAGDELAPSTTAKVVRLDDGVPQVVDGPYAETREQLGGYFLVDCDLETALGYAARIPTATHGAIEVRAIVDGP